MNYAEQYRHPKWQKMRLRVMERDAFRCQCCGTKEKTLNVHHWYYEKGAKVWEYPESALGTLCEECHSDIEDRKTAANHAAIFLPGHLAPDYYLDVRLLAVCYGMAKSLASDEDLSRLAPRLSDISKSILSLADDIAKASE